MDRAFEAIKQMDLPVAMDFEGFVIGVSASLTGPAHHGGFLRQYRADERARFCIQFVFDQQPILSDIRVRCPAGQDD